MNETEKTRARWSRLEGVLKGEVGNGTHELEATIGAIIAAMKAVDDGPDGAGGMPDPELVEKAVALASKVRTVRDVVLPAVERQAAAAHFNPDPWKLLSQR